MKILILIISYIVILYRNFELNYESNSDNFNERKYEKTEPMPK